MSSSRRTGALRAIEKNIKRYGFHSYLVQDSETPRYAYTIGLQESLGGELVMPGCIYYMADELAAILHAAHAACREAKQAGATCTFVIGPGGDRFAVRPVDSSWISLLMLGACDFHGHGRVAAFQLVPTGDRWTMDVPDMREPWSPRREPVWRWRVEPWPYSVPSTSTVTTNLDAMRGKRVTEVTRWEDGWEMFAGPGPDVREEDMRVAPLGTFLAADPSTEAVLDLEVGEGLWRDEHGGAWHEWRKRESPAD